MKPWAVALLGVVVSAPAAAAESAHSTGPQAHIQVELEPQEVSLVRQVPQPNRGDGATALQRQGYDWVCGGKCELVLPPGRHTFALSADSATVVSPSVLEVPAGRSTLRGRYEKGSAVLPWVLIGTSPVTWYASLMVMKSANGGESVSGGQIALGSGIALTQLLAGIVLLTRPRESAMFTLVPAVAASTGSRFNTEWAVAQSQLNGVSFQIAF